MKCYIKRLLDIVFSFLLIIVLSPVFLTLYLLCRIKLGTPVFFCQNRVGKNSSIFTMYKFRSMIDIEDENGMPLPDELRLTHFGKMLRQTSLDELPELFNILLGDMSFVGPRPLLIEYLPLYSDEQARRHEVTPGLTGWAQINGRNAISWEHKFRLDVWYVDHWSIRLDLKILLLTIIKVLKRTGIYGEGEATMSKFKGNKEETS